MHEIIHHEKYGTFPPLKYLGFGFGVQFRYLVFTVFPNLKEFQDIWKYNGTEANSKRKILSEPIIFTRDNALNYLKC